MKKMLKKTRNILRSKSSNKQLATTKKLDAKKHLLNELITNRKLEYCQPVVQYLNSLVNTKEAFIYNPSPGDTGVLRIKTLHKIIRSIRNMRLLFNKDPLHTKQQSGSFTHLICVITNPQKRQVFRLTKEIQGNGKQLVSPFATQAPPLPIQHPQGPPTKLKNLLCHHPIVKKAVTNQYLNSITMKLSKTTNQNEREKILIDIAFVQIAQNKTFTHDEVWDKVLHRIS